MQLTAPRRMMQLLFFSCVCAVPYLDSTTAIRESHALAIATKDVEPRQTTVDRQIIDPASDQIVSLEDGKDARSETNHAAIVNEVIYSLKRRLSGLVPQSGEFISSCPTCRPHYGPGTSGNSGGGGYNP
ncbi:hypothetical protein O6H91_Y007200 [Diphasiastrum complanatum]|nr:hypothetical protein O6H91_Y007200 [Diphasiastrum complanatum]